jgi:hypothetical protein
MPDEPIQPKDSQEDEDPEELRRNAALTRAGRVRRRFTYDPDSPSQKRALQLALEKERKPMSEVTREQVQELLDHATPGPWDTDGDSVGAEEEWIVHAPKFRWGTSTSNHRGYLSEWAL